MQVALCGLFLPLTLTEARFTVQNFPRFTAWLGNYSSGSKQRRLMSDITTNMTASGHISGGRNSVRLDYLPAMKAVLTRPLQLGEDGSVQDIVDVMQVGVFALPAALAASVALEAHLA